VQDHQEESQRLRSKKKRPCGTGWGKPRNNAGKWMENGGKMVVKWWEMDGKWLLEPTKMI